ncbi:MAG: hypothetical protein KGV43_03785, partial [Arcobacter sp.]|nr:hypothetical protein [Arcobacter sp.]
ITSPITDRKWLDRNLGATQVCTKSRDDFGSDEKYVISQKNCFGDYYQWGRYSDGHEKITSQAVSINDVNFNKPKTYKGKFIISDADHDWDWTTIDGDGSKRKAFWSKTDGTSICPIGFRVPSLKELKDETTSYAREEDLASGKVKVTNRDTAFKNFLKFPASRGRASGDGSLAYFPGSSVWSSSPLGFNGGCIYFSVARAGICGDSRLDGLSVRCIKHKE